MGQVWAGRQGSADGCEHTRVHARLGPPPAARPAHRGDCKSSHKWTEARAPTRRPCPCPALLTLPARLKLASCEASQPWGGHRPGLASLARAGPVSHTAGQAFVRVTRVQDSRASPRTPAWPLAASSPAPSSARTPGSKRRALSSIRHGRVLVLTSGFFLHDYLCSWILFLTTRLMNVSTEHK